MGNADVPFFLLMFYIFYNYFLPSQHLLCFQIYPT